MAKRVRLGQRAGCAHRIASLAAFTEQSGIEVSVETSPAEAFHGASRRAFQGEPTWDLVAPDEVVIAEQLRAGRLEPLGRRAHHTGLDLDDVPQAAIDRFRAGDMVYAVPAAAASNVLIYRADLLDRYGIAVPITWDELSEATAGAQAAARADGRPDMAGFVASGLAGYDENYRLLGSTVLPSWGWRWNRGAGQPPLVHEASSVAALERYVALLRESGSPGASAMGVLDSRRRYAEGRAVFTIDTATAFVAMRREGGAAARASAIALAPIGPSGRPEPGLFAPSYCIPVTSDAKDEAWELLRWMVSAERQLTDAVEEGWAEPARSSVLQTPAYEAEFGVEFTDVVRRTRAYARINRPLIPFGIELGDIVGAAAEAAIAGEQRADEALRVAQAMIDAMSWTEAKES